MIRISAHDAAVAQMISARRRRALGRAASPSGRDGEGSDTPSPYSVVIAPGGPASLRPPCSRRGDLIDGPQPVQRARIADELSLLMTNDAMRHIRLLQVCDLFLGELNGQSPDGVFQMRDLRCPDDRRRHRLLL